MKWALWSKAIVEARGLLLAGLVFGFAFQWVFIWMTGQVPLGNLKMILNLLPPITERLSSVPLSQIATSTGRIAIGYDHPLVLVLFSMWGIARGSDAVSGELGRGTLEMVLAQPVTRLGVLTVQAMVTIAGAAILALATWLGTWCGLATVQLEEPVSAAAFVPAAMNLFALGLFLAGVSTLASSWDRYRSRTIGLLGVFYATSMVLKVLARGVPSYEWLGYLSFLTPFEPQRIIGQPASAWLLVATHADSSWLLGGLGLDAVLIGLGLAAYALAATIFCHRDLPAPL